jgi:DNA-binding transcriptional MerR regulator
MCQTGHVLSVLERVIYSEAEAARYLGMPQSTLHYWLEGGVRNGRHHEPIIRIELKGTRSVTCAEFVEAGLLRQYRKKNVPMAELRAFVQLLRQSFNVPYPLAHQLPFVGGRRLVVEAQQRAGLDKEFWLMAPVDDQLMLLPPRRRTSSV